MPVTVHEGVSTDLTSLVQALSDLPLLARYHMGPTQLHDALLRAMSRGEVVLVARSTSEREVCGVAWGTKRGALGQGAYLRLLLVAHKHNRKGVGALLLDAFESACDSPPGGIFALTEQDVGSAPFYQARGFAALGALPDFVRAGHTELLLWKRT